ncbi:MAG: Probable component of the lipoprotein assembly complex (forms a complex with YaeT, YfgL, and NlpB) [uncultured Thiotrichaceae bacterium]|uniref:Outer membrane protein assembly factor BamD n=1 Tax=uncultured Thiotrichaceae bacterium TaxID=298394 RepID=A0A6S6T2M3_9GAMM|nr:MAG: Probable component of the lipoprotein assembly complex (forms a complex with YaeT, YfgL, and NlpB) [uncultured Thiotrichaceae bacterium]
MISLLSFSVAACSSLGSGGKDDPAETMSASALYGEAKTALTNKQYERAIKLYETLEARFPLGQYVQQAQLETAYAHYKYDEADTALDTIDRFVRMNPGSDKMAYAWYLRGLVNFNRDGSMVDKIFPRSITDLDTVRQKEAFQDFSRVVTRYPSSQYAADSKARIQYLRNSLAQSEVNVAQYYMDRSAWLAAFNRAEYAIKHYQGSPAIIEALVIKIKAARQLGKNDLAADSLQVLKTNFPEQAAKLTQ